MKEKLKLYFNLFKETFMLSAFTFGGGYVIISMMKKRFVDKLKIISEEEMLDYVAIAQATPGPIAISGSVLIGYNTAGVPGAVAATLGTTLPPLLIIMIISVFYAAFKDNIFVSLMLAGMQAGAAAVVCDAVFSLAEKVYDESKFYALIVMAVSFAVVYFLSVNIFIVLICALLCGILYFKAKEKKK